MKELKADFVKIYQTEREILVLMFFNLVLSVGLLTYSIVSLDPNAAVVKIGYGDIGGYRDGSWMSLLAFPILAIIFGVFHNILALRIFQKRGGGMTKFFLITTIFLIFGAILVLTRLLGER